MSSHAHTQASAVPVCKGGGARVPSETPPSAHTGHTPPEPSGPGSLPGSDSPGLDTVTAWSDLAAAASESGRWGMAFILWCGGGSPAWAQGQHPLYEVPRGGGQPVFPKAVQLLVPPTSSLPTASPALGCSRDTPTSVPKSVSPGPLSCTGSAGLDCPGFWEEEGILPPWLSLWNVAS